MEFGKKNNRFWGLGFWIALLAIFISAMFQPASAGNFSAENAGDFNGVAVMEATGAYDANVPGRGDARLEVAGTFYEAHPDNYDFLIVFTKFDYAMPGIPGGGSGRVAAFYTGIKNDVQGIGRDIFDNTEWAGSAGKLQGMVDMGCMDNLAWDPLDPKFSRTMTTLSHEVAHRWAAFVKFRRTDGSISGDLLGAKSLDGVTGSHWSVMLDSSGSPMYGNPWRENGDGTFTSLPGRKYFSPLDMYLMGFADASEVSPMLLIQNPDIDNERLPLAGETIEGTASHVSIGDIIAAEGERIPSFEDSQKSFRLAAIYLTRPGDFEGPEELAGVRSVVENWTIWFSSLTGGRATVTVEASPMEDLPENPGVDPLPHEPRETPPEIEEGVAWLTANQEDDGSWADASWSAERDTSAALSALMNYPEALVNFTAGIDWLEDAPAETTDYISRKIEIFARSGLDTAALEDQLISLKNPDGGFGNSPSTVYDTAFAIAAAVTEL